MENCVYIYINEPMELVKFDRRKAKSIQGAFKSRHYTLTTQSPWQCCIFRCNSHVRCRILFLSRTDESIFCNKPAKLRKQSKISLVDDYITSNRN